jgi:cytochrome P450
LIPAHTGLRGLSRKAFLSGSPEKQDFLDNLIAMRIESLRDKAQFDVVADYAATIPGVVICSLLGVPVEDQEMFSGWLADQFRLLGPSLPSDALLEEVDQSAASRLHKRSDRETAKESAA